MHGATKQAAPRPAIPVALAVALAVAAPLAACRADALAPPADVHARADARLGDELGRHLAALPGVERASVVVHTPFVDPLAPAGAADTPRASVVLRLAPGGDADRAADAARAAVVATVPGLRADAVAVAAAAPPAAAALARVGPFRVTAGSRPALLATLAAALVVIAALATWIATLLYARRRGIRPQ